MTTISSIYDSNMEAMDQKGLQIITNKPDMSHSSVTEDKGHNKHQL